eukprot:TRINITY_DN11998_c0_g1_i1.p1 TRINITY_DN11998_c0_g1~~TRINITY_DN11998_c0_g1_i1.p1  ORF type:complete len:159 (+),score=22.48 TRINITY_DN11998_c0_g1_i1:43-477(+)
MTENLTEKQTEQKEVFKLFQNENSNILTSQLADVMRYLGTSPTQSELKQMLSTISGDEVSLEKFLELIEQQSKREGTVKEDLLQIFKIFDKNNTGGVSRQDLKHVLTTVGDALNDDEIDEIIKEANLNKDGHIIYEDFVKMLLE